MVRASTRDEWGDLIEVFEAFFHGFGEVETDEERAVFAAGYTGLSLTRQGHSQSFMPLHRFGATWDEVLFDLEAREVHLRSRSTTYTYRVPQDLSTRG